MIFDSSRSSLPLLPLRSEVIFPRQLTSVEIGRPLSIAGLKEAVKDKEIAKVILAVQKEATKDEVTLDDLYPIATLAIIKLIRETPQGAQILLLGEQRVRLLHLETNSYWNAQYTLLSEVYTPTLEVEALHTTAKELFTELLQNTAGFHPALLSAAQSEKDPGVLTDLMASVTQIFTDEERIQLLQECDISRRLHLLLGFLAHAKEVSLLSGKIRQDVEHNLEKMQKEVYLREQIGALTKELNELRGLSNDDGDDLHTRIENSTLPEAVKTKALKEAQRLNSIPSMSPEVGMLRTYLEWLLDLPWQNNTENEQIDLSAAKLVLDQEHYGLPKIKERILEWMAIRDRLNTKSTNTKLQTPILCFYGPPGVGKTSLGISIAHALNRKLVRVSLGGIRDEAEIRGHRRTYIGALPGRIIQALKQAGTNNPVMLLDEIDKLGTDFRGNPESALLEVLDPEQNKEFSDHYIEIPYDLSQVLFITTANTIDTISPPLRDRLELIKLSGYTEEEKLQIALQHLLPRQLTQHALTPSEALISPETIQQIIRHYTHEAGVRNLERQLAQVLRKIPHQLQEQQVSSLAVNPANLIDYLGPWLFDENDLNTNSQIGIVNGVVVSDVGGEVITIEAIAGEGPPSLQVTGQIGNVMQESAQAALTWTKARGSAFGVPEHFFAHHFIHIHIPAGAVPKEGPSAGVTLATALVSVAASRPVRSDVAMTGELTLRGRILPIGGVRDKLLAAHRSGIKTFFLPKQNQRDLYDLEPQLLEGMEIIYVSQLEDVLNAALLPPTSSQPRPLGFMPSSFSLPSQPPSN